ncbi:hypothetical protein F4777DRAFT_63233 [Nemania sp. FL0916]|nr:hypothetical protein F4777DRAFT_63233 [Nemania sp. FL0916]
MDYRMSSFTFPWSVSRLFTRPLRFIIPVFLIYCGLHVAFTSAPKWAKWISKLRTLRRPRLQPTIRGESLPAVDAHPLEEDNAISVDSDTTSSNEVPGDSRGRGGWLNLFSLNFSWRRSQFQTQNLPLRDQSPPPRAMCPIDILHVDEDAVVDIVAVHGLAANPDYAWIWQPKNNPRDSKGQSIEGYPTKHVNWLKELLPDSLSSAQLPCRVITFNYDSRWFMDAPQQRLSNISDNLLTSLQSARDKATTRPLIFIGHSFGGNLIEQAIVSACLHGSEHAIIAQSTVGVIFLGTPHRGSNAASWGHLIASLAPSSFSCEYRILEALKEHSDSSTDRLKLFSRWLFSESLPVVCFFELQKTDYSSRIGPVAKIKSFKDLVVPEHSAGIDGHTTISLNTDHLKINKFYGPNDASFRLVFPQIERMARGAEETIKRRLNRRRIPENDGKASLNVQRYLREMRVTNPKDILSRIVLQKGDRVRNTCHWILDQKEFSTWAASGDPELLRLIGSPGIGKTIMSTFLVETLTDKAEKSHNSTFAYFFCDDKIQDRKTPTAILRSLIWQLLLQREELSTHIKSDFDKHKDDNRFNDLFDDFFPLWRIFQNMVLDVQAGEVFILIDALDECDKSTRKGLLQNIKSLFRDSPKTGHKVKFLVTCRPDIADIEGALKNVGVSLRMDSAHVNNDLLKYIDAKTQELAEAKGYQDSLIKKIRDTFRTESGGTFLWVSLMVAELGREDVLISDVQKKLKELPHGLDELTPRFYTECPAASNMLLNLSCISWLLLSVH